MATLTKSTGTVTLSGAAEKVTLPASYGWVWVKNMSEGDIFAGLSADISEGADGVMTIPSGECGRVQTDGFSSIYLLGTGNALVVAQNYADCPFKVVKKGGEIPDLSEYAKKTDVPGIKVNEAVNADTVGGIQAVDFRQITSIGINTLPTPPSSEGDYFVNHGDSSFPYEFGNLSIRYGSYTSEFAAIYQTTGNDKSIWYNLYLGGWVGWKEISTTPIKSAAFSGTTGNGGNMVIWDTSERKIPLLAEIVDLYCFTFLSSSNAGCYMIHAFDSDGDKALTTVSGTVYYIEI